MTSQNKIKTDTILKNFWKNNDRFADLFNAYLFKGKQVIKPEELTESDTDISSVIKLNNHAETIQKVLDVVKKTARGIDFVILGIENQQKIHYAMPLRHMIGDAFSYLKEYNELAVKNKKEKSWENPDEFLSKFKKTDRLHPMITVCIYYGEEKWDGPRSLVDMLEIPEEFKTLVSDYKFNLIEVRNSENLKFNNKDVSTIFDITRFIYNREYDKINHIYRKQTITTELGLVIGAITETQKIIDDALKLEEKGEGMNMCKALEELEARGEARGEVRGEARGKVRGEALAKILLIQKKMQRGDSLAKISDDLLEEVEIIKPIYNVIKEHPEKRTEEIYELLNNLE